jgi:hypothetical protein
MTKLIVADYEPKHLEKLQPRLCHQGEVPKHIMTHSITVLNGDQPIAILGGFKMSPKIIQIWALLSDEIQKCPIAFHKICLKVLEFYEMKEKPRRMQIDVRVDYPTGQRWAESLGFVQEGCMQAYAPDGSSSYLYARVNS